MKSLVCARWNLPVERARQIMESHQVKNLPVIDEEGFVVGILGDKEVQRATNSTRPFLQKNPRVADLMQYPVIRVDESTLVSAVVQSVVEERVSSFLVSREDQVVGIVTTEDLLLYFLHKEAKEAATTLKDVRFQALAEESGRELALVGT